MKNSFNVFVLRWSKQREREREREVGGPCNTHREKRNPYRVVVGKSKGKNHLEDLGVDGRIILKWITKTRNERM